MLLHIETQDDKISPITIEEASGADAAREHWSRHQVKGKQVGNLYDLVTVNRECKAMREERGH